MADLSEHRNQYRMLPGEGIECYLSSLLRFLRPRVSLVVTLVGDLRLDEVEALAASTMVGRAFKYYQIRSPIYRHEL